MTWTPESRILNSALPPSTRLRGVCPCELMAWSDALLSSGHDYSLDFSDQIPEGDRIVEVLATATGGSVAWNSIFGTKATAWVQWSQAGMQSISFDIVLASGATLSASGWVSVGCRTTGLPPTAPEYAPNDCVFWGVILPDANGNPLIFG